MSTTPEPVIPSEIDRAMSDEEFLAAMEDELVLLDRVKEHEGEEQAMLWLIMEISTLCIQQAYCHLGQTAPTMDQDGAQEAFESYTEKILTAAQNYWVRASAYLKGTNGIELHPLGLLASLHYVFSDTGESDDKEASTRQIVMKFSAKILNELDTELRRDLQGETIVPVPEIDNFSGDPKELIPAYFFYMMKLGTFHRNRDSYETEEQKVMHDKLLAIHRRIGTIDF